MAFLVFYSLSTRLIMLRILITSDFAALASVRGMSIYLSFHVIRFCSCCVDFFNDSTFLFVIFLYHLCPALWFLWLCLLFLLLLYLTLLLLLLLLLHGLLLLYILQCGFPK